MLHIVAPPLPTLIAAGEDTYNVGQSHPNRQGIGVFDLLIVTNGSLYIGEEENHFHVKKHQALILYPDCHHFSFRACTETTHFYWFHFSAKEWMELHEASGNRNVDRREEDSGNPFTERTFGILLEKYCPIHNALAVETICEQILYADNEALYRWEWKRQMLFQQLLQELSNNTKLSQSLPSLAIAEQAAAYLRKNFQRKVSYQELGEVLNFHPNHIARCMISTLGCTPIEYVNRVRLDQAKILLLSKDWSIEEISIHCGFSQLAYFSRMFKKQEGVSPNQFRKKFMSVKEN